MRIDTRSAARDLSTLAVADAWLTRIAAALESPDFGPAERAWLDEAEADLQLWRAALRRQKFTPEALAARDRLVGTVRVLQDLPRRRDGTIAFTLWHRPGDEAATFGVARR